MELSENLKFRNDPQAGNTTQDRPVRPLSISMAGSSEGPLDLPDDAESQMRKALGLLGETPRHRADTERSDPQARTGGGFNGGLHRRRFVQDGDVPVTVLRRDPAHEQQLHRSVAAAVTPTTSRLQRTEAALAAETAARDKAERLLSETQAIVRDLQTKIGHAELAKNEAVETLLREREQAAQYRADDETRDARLHEAEERAKAAEQAASSYQEQLQEERLARKAAEKAQRIAEAARDVAEQMVRTLSEELPAPLSSVAARPVPPRPEVAPYAASARGRTETARSERPKAEPVRRARPVAEPKVVAAVTRRGKANQAAVAEPEPVKWWLNAKPVAKKR